MAQNISYRSYEFRPPLWRSAKELNGQTFALILVSLAWVVLYLWLGWRLWSVGVEHTGLAEIGVVGIAIATGIPLALGWRSALRRWRTRLQKREWPALSLDEINKLTPSQFEAYVAERLFARQGYLAENVRDTKDGGVDIVVTDPQGRRAIVQCKLYRSGVGEPIVRDLYGALIHSEAYMAYLVTSSHFSAAARRWAVGKPIALIDGPRLVELSKAEAQLQS